jgi:hypothetical protein
MDRVKKADRIFRMWLLLLRSPLQFTSQGFEKE